MSSDVIIYKIELPEGYDGEGKQGTETSPSDTEIGAVNADNPTEPKSKKGSVNKALGAVVVKSVIKQAGSYAASNIGKWTGDSVLQDRVNAGISMATTAGMVGVGLATGNYAMVAVTLATSALSLAQNAIDLAYEQKWSNKAADQQAYRIGIISTRSR